MTITPAVISGSARVTVMEMTTFVCELMYRAVRNYVTDFDFVQACLSRAYFAVLRVYGTAF